MKRETQPGLQGPLLTSWPLTMGAKGRPETSVQNYHSTLHNIREESRSHLQCGGSLKSRPYGNSGKRQRLLQEFWKEEFGRLYRIEEMCNCQNIQDSLNPRKRICIGLQYPYFIFLPFLASSLLRLRTDYNGLRRSSWPTVA
jgi:hypothetical protein